MWIILSACRHPSYRGGSVVTHGTELIFTLEMTPPETAVICIGPDQTAEGIPYAWIDSFGMATNGYVAAAGSDGDADGYTAAQEYIIETDPAVPDPAFEVDAGILPSGQSFQTLENRLYTIYGTDSLTAPDWQPVGDPVQGTGTMETWVDPEQNISNRFYRFEVQLPL